MNRRKVFEKIAEQGFCDHLFIPISRLFRRRGWICIYCEQRRKEVK
jgi:hypothetical protein